MVWVPLRTRLVEVVADRGELAAEQYRYGSGCIVVGRTVLTAAHVVAEAVTVQVRDPNKRLYSATMDPQFVGDANGPGPDLALVEIDDPGYAEDLPPIGLARVDRDGPTDEPVERCHAIGYPWFAETPSPTAVRDTVDAIGVVPVLSKLAAGLLSVQVRYPPRPLPPEEKSLADSEWSGMSGGPVVAAGRLLGVVTEHAPREGPSAITAVPLTALEPDPAHPKWGPGVEDPSGWWARLGVSGLADLQRLPAPPERTTPAYLGKRVVGERVSSAVAVFRDHVEFCARLRDLVLAREKPIICVTGRRGIGKSGLVAKVLADFEEPAEGADERVGGLAYLSTRTDVGVIDLARIFHALADLLPQDQRDRLEEQWTNVRTAALPDLLAALRAHNVVLVLDDLDRLQDPETGELTSHDLVTFLTAACRDPQPPLVVTTSRHPIEPPLEILGRITPLEIDDGLEADDAVELMRQLDAYDRLRDLPDVELRQAVERVYRMPRGIQLLVRLLGRKRRTATLRRLLDAKDTPEALLDQLVSEGFHSLDEAGRDIVRLLALADTPLPAGALPDMLAHEHPPDAVTRTVERLDDTQVIDVEPNTDRARLHPIDSDYVRGTLLADPGKRVALDLRLADWLATQRTDPLTWRTSADVGPQRREIRHRLRASDGHGAVRVMADIVDFLASHGEADQLADALELGQRYADTPDTRAAYEMARGAVDFYAGSLQEAIEAFRTGRDAAEEAGDQILTAGLDLWLGTALRHAGDVTAALEPLIRASHLPSTDQASHEIVLKSVFQRGIAACYLGDAAQAEEAAARIVAMLREDDLSVWRAHLADLRTLIALLRSDYASALAEVEQGIASYADSPSQGNAGYLINVRGLVLLAQGRAKKAVREFITVRKDAAALHQLRLEGLAALNLAWARLTLGDRIAAAALAREAADLLATNRVRETQSAQALAAACDAREMDTMLQGLRHAVRASHGNPDLYQPSDEVLTNLAAGLF